MAYLLGRWPCCQPANSIKALKETTRLLRLCWSHYGAALKLQRVIKVIWHKAVSPRHWRHLANTIELVLPSAHRSPQPKQQIDQFSRFCTAHGRKTLYFTMGAPFPQNCPSNGGLDMVPWAHPSPQSKRHLDRFVYVCSTAMRPNNDI